MSAAHPSVWDLVPGGILASDHAHVGISDETCSRCRRAVGEGEAPLRLWINNGECMWIYCDSCRAAPVPSEKCH